MKPHNIFADSGVHQTPAIRRAWRSLMPAGVLLMTALVLSSCGGDTKAEKEKAAAAPPPPVPVVVAPVIQKTVPIFSEFTARADARDTVEIRARVEAFLDGITSRRAARLRRNSRSSHSTSASTWPHSSPPRPSSPRPRLNSSSPWNR